MPTNLLLKLAACLALVAALIFGWHSLTSHYDQQGYDRAKSEYEAAAQEQATRNRELQRQAELRYTVKREAQDRFFTVTTKEAVHEAESLATCAVPEPVRMHLNAAADCARGDSPGSCGVGDGVPGAR